MTVQEQINAALMKLSMAQQKLQRISEDIRRTHHHCQAEGWMPIAHADSELAINANTLLCHALGNIADAQKVMVESVLDIGQRAARPVTFIK
jgi:hypothetical protein